MRGDLALLVLVLTPTLLAPKGCYYGSDVVPLGYNAAGAGFGEAGASAWGDSGSPDDDDGVPPPSGGCGGIEVAGGSGGRSAGGATNTAGAPAGGSTVIVLRPH